MPASYQRQDQRSRKADALMQQLSRPVGDGQGTPGDDPFADAMAQPTPLDFANDTRLGEPRVRRGSGARLGDATAASGRPAAQPRQAPGMVSNTEAFRREELIQGMAAPPSLGGDVATVTQRAPQRPTSDAMATRLAQQGRRAGAPGGIHGIDIDSEGRRGTGATGPSPMRGTLARIRAASSEIVGAGRGFVAPWTYMAAHGGGLASLGLWLNEEKMMFIPLMIVFLVIGMLFSRYVSLVAGVLFVIIGMWIENLNDDETVIKDRPMDPFIIYICGFMTFALPFIIS